MPMKPEFRAAFTMAAAGVFVFTAGVATVAYHTALGGAAALTGALLLAVAFPRLWSALPGTPTGRIVPPIPAARPTATAARPIVDLFADDPAPAATPAPPDGIDPETGELIPDNLELARRLERLADVVAEQSELVAAALVKINGGES